MPFISRRNTETFNKSDYVEWFLPFAAEIRRVLTE